MFGKFRQEAPTNLQHSSYAAQNVTTHSENTAEHSDFAKGRIIKLAFQLRNFGYSEAYLKTLIRTLSCIASKVDIDNTEMVLEFMVREKWRDSYKSNLFDFYGHYCKFYNIAFSKPKHRRDHKVPRVSTEEKINLILGHKNINNTFVCTHLVNFNDKDEFYSATAKTVEEAKKLIEEGFDFVCDINAVKLFRKRK